MPFKQQWLHIIFGDFWIDMHWLDVGLTVGNIILQMRSKILSAIIWALCLLSTRQGLEQIQVFYLSTPPNYSKFQVEGGSQVLARLQWSPPHSFQLYIYDESKTTDFNSAAQAVSFNRTKIGMLTASYIPKQKTTIYVKVVLLTQSQADYHLTLDEQSQNSFVPNFVEIGYTTLPTKQNITIAPFRLSREQEISLRMSGSDLPLYLFQESSDYQDLSQAIAVSDSGQINMTLTNGYWVAVVVNPGTSSHISQLIIKLSAFCPTNYEWNSIEGQCTRNCESDPNAQAYRSGSIDQCSCNKNFEWNQTEKRCVIFCKADPYSIGRVDGKAEECLCVEDYGWDYSLMSCLRICPQIPQQTYIEEICICQTDYLWNQTQDICVWNCSIDHNAVSYQANSRNKCDCKKNYIWNTTENQCVANCRRENSMKGRDAFTVDRCTCEDGYQWNSQQMSCESQNQVGLVLGTTLSGAAAIGAIIAIVLWRKNKLCFVKKTNSVHHSHHTGRQLEGAIDADANMANPYLEHAREQQAAGSKAGKGNGKDEDYLAGSLYIPS